MSEGNGATDPETGSPADNASSPADSVQSEAAQQLTAEEEKPWPSTFERSISLLASPIIDAKTVDHFTRSPKPGGTPLTGRRAGRGYLTPEMSSLIGPAVRGGGGDMQQGVARVQSLDFKSKYNSGDQPDIKPLRETQKEQSKKAAEAKAYRQKLLQKQRAEGETWSPGQKKDKAKKKGGEHVSLEARATFLQCVFNMSNILMGVGLLGLPFVLRSSGWGGGLFCIVVFGYITWRTSILIGCEMNGDPRPSSYFDDSPFKTPLPPGSCAQARLRPPVKSFPDIARASFGETGCILLSLVLYFELFSCLCIFFVTIGDHLHTLFPSVSQQNHMITAAFISTVPTVLLRTPRLLSYLSMVGTFATIAVVSAVVLSAVVEGDISDHVKHERVLQEAEASAGIESHDNSHIWWRTSGLPLSMGLVAYCFSGHAIVPSIYSSMQRPQDFDRMIGISFSIVIVACLAVGFSGYYMFGSGVLDQVTLSLEQNSSAGLAMTILTWLMIMTAFSKYTLTMYPLALGMEEIVAPYLSSERFMQFTSSIIKLFLTVLALMVSIFVPSFSFLCALVGMICTMAVSVIFPAAAHLKLFNSTLSPFEKIVDWVFVIIGVVMAVVGTIATI